MTAFTLLAELADHVREVGAAERCGLIFPDGRVLEIQNIHDKPERGFRMDPITFLAGLEAGATETWHTHPCADPNLSEEDMEGFRQWPGLTHHIVGLRDGEAAVATFKVIDDGVVVNA